MPWARALLARSIQALPIAGGVFLPAGAGRRLLRARLLLVAGEALVLALASGQGFLVLPWTPLLLLLGLHAGLVALQALAQRQGVAAGQPAVFAQLLADAVLIAALVYFSGGYANPFISLLLLPLVLTAALLPTPYAWVMTGVVASLYTLLMSHYHPLRLDLTDREAGHLHLTGMWLSFLFTAALVAAFVARLRADLRARDEALAEAREAALRDEQLFALGMQAAAAAHDLATPLSTLGLELEELQAEFANDEELAPALARIAAQTARMQALLARLRAFAASTRDARRGREAVDRWLESLLEHWRLMRPQVTVRLHLNAADPAPRIPDEPLLTSTLITLLNNAADVSPAAIDVEARWSQQAVEIQILDRGPGPGAGAAKPEGWGVGLQLAQAALHRLGGRLELGRRPGGGTCARIRLLIAPDPGVSMQACRV